MKESQMFSTVQRLYKGKKVYMDYILLSNRRIKKFGKGLDWK